VTIEDVDLDLADSDPRLSRPDSNTGLLQRALLARFRIHQADGTIPTNPRFLFYELEQRGVVSKINPLKPDGQKRVKEDRQYLSEALTILRDRRIIPWPWVIDERREYTSWRTAPTVADYVVGSLDRAALDPWAGQPAPLILCESGDIGGVLNGIASDYTVPITATSGQAKAHLINEVAPNLKPGQRVLYLGDADLSGGQIEDHTATVLVEYAPEWARSAGGVLVPIRPGSEVLVPRLWERLALTNEQVANSPELQRLIIRKEDHRYKPARVHEAVELETLGQRQIMDMVIARLDALIPQSLSELQVLEDTQRAEVRELLRRAGLIQDDE
jgi:hypothetical protein